MEQFILYMPGFIKRVYYIIDVWHGFEYSSGSEYISNPFHNNLRHFKRFTKASFHYKWNDDDYYL